ncbi:MAG: ABC transporter ATP-binding protein [Anaerolineae bacterium]|nr:ABC transporter ATP-binding protein [Anaerolineae bacterium]
MNPLIDIQSLSKHYPSQKKGIDAVHGVNLQLHRGEMVGLVGPDGAGKTTILRILATTLPPTSGSVTVNGLDLRKNKEHFRRRIGYMPQNFSLYPDLTVRENMSFFADINEVPQRDREERMQSMLAFTRLAAFQSRKAQDLSGGMKKKLALACSLMHNPEILILDEPSTGVDPVSRRELWLILSRVVHQGVSVLVSTPYMDEAERCSRVAILYRGEILETGQPKALESRLPFDVVEYKATPRKSMYRTVEDLPGMLNYRPIGDRLRLSVQNAQKTILLLKWRLTREGIRSQILRKVSHTMEDVFMNLVYLKHGAKAPMIGQE